MEVVLLHALCNKLVWLDLKPRDCCCKPLVMETRTEAESWLHLPPCKVGELEAVVAFRPSPSCCMQGSAKGEWLLFIETLV